MKRPSPTQEPRVFRGVAVAPGIAIGRARRLADLSRAVEERRLSPGSVEGEIQRFRDALARAQGELKELRRAAAKDLGEDDARIFDVQILVLQDPMAVERTVEAIRAEGKNAEFLWSRHLLEVADHLAGQTAFFGERAVDLLDVKRRVLRHLSGDSGQVISEIKRGVLLSRELAPSEALLLDPRRVLGFATDSGGRTSHAAIMARARGIPAVVGLKGLYEAVQDGDLVALDGFRGVVEVHPGSETLERLQSRRRAFLRVERLHTQLAGLPAQTKDGHRVQLLANMELPSEGEYIKKRGAEGIGLFRTEFFFISRPQAPSEDEQVAVYRQVLAEAHPAPVVIRTLDLGGDKLASYMKANRERNPFLGLRGIRFLLAHPEILRTQLRAILRAGAGHKARILLPMVHSIRELRATRELLDQILASLRRRRVPHDPQPELGVMIEVPSAVMMADEMAREADFLSVGSNDLIQYLLAMDRDNEALFSLYQPLHPAVLRALRMTVDAGHRHGRLVSICGEMASDPLAVPLLLGLGFDRLSVSPFMLPEIKQTIRALSQEDCRRLSGQALEAEEPAEVLALIEEQLGSRFSDLLRLSREANGNEGPSSGGRAAKPRRISKAVPPPEVK